MKFKVRQLCSMTGDLRNGYLQGVVDASSKEEALLKFKNHEVYLDMIPEDFRCIGYRKETEPEVEEIEEGYEFKFDLESVWYIMQACIREQANVETNIRIMPDRLDNMDFINQCKRDSKQYAKILKQLAEVMKEEL